MHVFDDQNDALAGTLEFIEHRREDALATRARGECSEQRAADLTAHIAQRPERLRCRERIACTPERTRLRAAQTNELAHECRLADARLAGDEHDAAAIDMSAV